MKKDNPSHIAKDQEARTGDLIEEMRSAKIQCGGVLKKSGRAGLQEKRKSFGVTRKREETEMWVEV